MNGSDDERDARDAYPNDYPNFGEQSGNQSEIRDYLIVNSPEFVVDKYSYVSNHSSHFHPPGRLRRPRHDWLAQHHLRSAQD